MINGTQLRDTQKLVDFYTMLKRVEAEPSKYAINLQPLADASGVDVVAEVLDSDILRGFLKSVYDDLIERGINPDA